MPVLYTGRDVLRALRLRNTARKCKACADAERQWQLATRERKAADKVRTDTVAPVRDKIALEGEIESLEQVLFEDTNKMVATERMRRTEAQCEVKKKERCDFGVGFPLGEFRWWSWEGTGRFDCVRGGHFETATVGFEWAAAVCVKAEVPERSVMQSIGGGIVGGGADRRERMSANQIRAPAVDGGLPTWTHRRRRDDPEEPRKVNTFKVAHNDESLRRLQEASRMLEARS
ncbi:hypothetical protein K438DRAFT_1947614 [Mycena galopus ATCC 62051]|nr:hypothetical protein K438DRAFT_1947614 [Mycena galopus ATCC 62051]